MDKLQLDQQKNRKVVTNWFPAITKKNNTALIQFDITEYTLNRALEFAAQHVPVSQNDIRIIKHCRKSLFFHDSKPWIKSLINNCSTSPWVALVGKRCVSWSVP